MWQLYAIWHPQFVLAHSSCSLVGCSTSKDMQHDGTQQLAYSLVFLCGLQAAHQCLPSAKARLKHHESLQIITLNFQKWKDKYELLQSAFVTTFYFFCWDFYSASALFWWYTEGDGHDMKGILIQATDETRHKQDVKKSLCVTLCNSMWHLYKSITVYFWQDHYKVIVCLRSQNVFEQLSLAGCIVWKP